MQLSTYERKMWISDEPGCTEWLTHHFKQLYMVLYQDIYGSACKSIRETSGRIIVLYSTSMVASDSDTAHYIHTATSSSHGIRAHEYNIVVHMA